MTINKSPLPRSIPRWSVPIIWAIGLIVLYGLAPWALSFISPRFGWADDSPAPINRLGLIVIALAFALLFWCISLHFARYQGRVPWESRPQFLLVRGPYSVSRNPLYIADSLILLGWSIFFGNLAVLAAALAYSSYLAFVLVPMEERQLREQFGDDFARYCQAVPRWIGKRKA